MSDELTARLVTDCLNGIDTIALAYEEILRVSKMSTMPSLLDDITAHWTMMYIDEFVSIPNTVVEHLQNELFAHKVILRVLRASGSKREHLMFHENKIHSLQSNIRSLTVVSW